MATQAKASKRAKGGAAKGGAAKSDDPFAPNTSKTVDRETERRVHVFGKEGNEIVCDTEPRGHETPGGASALEILVNESEGFIPLWAAGTTLRWRFREQSLKAFAKPAAAKKELRSLLAQAVALWGNAAPVKFTEDEDLWDFEIVAQPQDKCTLQGCVLARAFFPDPGRHDLAIYPKMLRQVPQERVETMAHEIGHMFGLRHFFAQVAANEKGLPSHLFGTHERFTIMNYGADSMMGDNDRNDLKRLYELAWSGQLKGINGTPIKLVKPYHTLAESTESVDPLALAAYVCPPVTAPVG